LAILRPRGVCGGANIFGSASLQPARSFCVSLGAFFLYWSCFFNSRYMHHACYVFVARQHAMHAERDIVLPVLSVCPSVNASPGALNVRVEKFFEKYCPFLENGTT